MDGLNSRVLYVGRGKGKRVGGCVVILMTIDDDYIFFNEKWDFVYSRRRKCAKL